MFNNTGDKNTNPQNNNPQPSLFSSNAPNADNKQPTPSLFGNSTGGLFGSTNPSTGLFSNIANNNLKTSQRKQGGLFANIPNKPPSNDEAPKLLFGSITSNPTSNSLFGNTTNNNPQKKQQNKNVPSFLSKPEGSSLFGGVSLPSGSLFSSNNNPPKVQTNANKKEEAKPTPSGSLFSLSKPQQNKQEKQKPQGGLFGNMPTGSLFGNTPSTLQSDNKQKTGSLFGNVCQSSLFGKKTQIPTLFGTTTKKQEQKKQPQGLFGTTTTSLLKPQKVQQTIQKDKPQFTLTGNVSDKSPSLSGGLFTKKQNQIKDQKPSMKVNNQQKNVADKPVIGLFGNKAQKTQMKEPQITPVSSLFGNSTLFANQKPEQKTKETAKEGGSLFDNQKKVAAQTNSGSLFGQKKQQNKTKQGSSNIGLFGNTLFGNKQPEINKVNPIPQIQTINKNEKQFTQIKKPQGLLATFSKTASNDQLPIKQDQQQQKRTNRTISFNQPLNNSQEITNKNNLTSQTKPTITTSLFTNKVPQTQSIDKKSPNQSSSVNLTQSFTKPATNDSPTGQIPVQGGTSSNISKPQKMQESFFKSEVPKKQTSSSTIFTAYEISNILKQQALEKSAVSNVRYGSEKNQRNNIKNIQEWISISFGRYNQIPTTQVFEKKYVLHTNQDINRFLNDIAREVIIVVNLPVEEKQFKLVNKLFFQLLDKLQIKQYLFNCAKVQVANQQSNQSINLQIVQLNTTYFIKHQIYKFSTEGIHLNLDSQQLQRYVLSLTKKFITNQLQYLEYLQNKTELLKMPSTLYYKLLTYCLKYKKMRIGALNVWRQKCPQIISLIQDFQKKIITKIVNLLSAFAELNYHDFLLFNKQLLPEFISLLQNFSYTEEQSIIHLSLKSILNNLGMGASSSNKSDIQLNPQVIASIKQTKSIQLLPFRTLISIYQNKSNHIIPSPHDLYRYINGPQWIDWLQIYLGNGNSSVQKEISVHEAQSIIKILKYPVLSTKRTTKQKMTPKQIRYVQNIQTKVLSRKRPIYKYIMSLKQQNMLNIFYEILMSIIYDYQSYRKVEEIFFRQKDQFNYQFRNVIAQICNYPTQKFKQEIPFLQQKVLYFLRIIQVAPQRTLALQKLVFEGTPLPHKKTSTKDEILQTLQKDKYINQQVGHRICHLIIDTINYFGIKNDQKIISKCISAVKSLLQNSQTSMAMKIAMAVNKPQMLFITNSLISPSNYRITQSLIIQMTQLLQLILTSQQFVHTLALKLYSNNSDDAHLQRMYPVRYSNKDYLPFVRQLLNHKLNDESNKVLQIKTTNIIITYSSYWILKCLQVLVQGFRQQRSASSQYGNNLLYIINLILQKLIIPISHEISYEQINNQMLQENIQIVNNPIYSHLLSNSIPKVLFYVTQALNNIDIVSILSQNLKYKLLKSAHITDTRSFAKNYNYYLTNQKLQDDFIQNQFTVYLSVKILKNILQTYRVYQQYKNAPIKTKTNLLQSPQNHFVYKLLSKFKWIQDIQFNIFLKGFSKTDLIQQQNNPTTNFVLGLITLLMINNKTQDNTRNEIQDIYQSTPLNLKQTNYQKQYIVPIQSGSSLNKKSSTQLSSFNNVQNFYSKFGSTLNYQVINNFLITSTNPYLQSYESLQCLVIQCLSLMISGQTLFGPKACITSSQSTINIGKFIGFYNNLDISAQIFSSMWLIQNLQTQFYSLLSSRNSSLQLKHTILDFLYQNIKSQKSSNNFIIAKKIFYKYLIRHLDQSAYFTDQQVNRLHLFVIRILNLLEDKDYAIMRQQCNDRLIDTLIGSMLKSTQKCLKSSNNLIKLIKSFNSKPYYSVQFAYYHLQRASQQRQIIKTGQAYEILKYCIQLIEKRFFDLKSSSGQGIQNLYKWKSIKKINSLSISLNLSYIGSTIHDSHLSKLSIKHVHQQESNQFYFNTNLPHNFGKNPLQLFLINARNLSYIEVSFEAYKQNVIDWVAFSAMRFGQRMLRFINWTLTVDKNLYGNQPIKIKSKQLQSPKPQNIICSMHMGNYRHSAVQLFADSQNEAINLIKTLYDESLRNLQKGMTVNQARCFSIMGYCLQWIRARDNTQDITQHLVRNTIKNSFWINQNSIKNQKVIKFVLSIVSIGSKIFDSNQFKPIRTVILDTIQTYKQGKSQLQQTLIQQLITILIAIPPELQDNNLICQLANIWKLQTNNEFFYNQSRLILQLCQKYPNQIAKLKVLRSCQKIKKANSHSYYNYSLRSPDSIALIWGLKIASTLMSNQMQTLLIFQEVSEFYNVKSQQIINLLTKNISSLSLVQIQQLKAVLQFILTLVSSSSWITVYRKQFQKLTYILSHKLINMFMDLINSKINYVAQSDMEKRFKKIKYQNTIEQIKSNQQNLYYDINIDKNSVFKMLIELKIIQCIKTFVLVLNRCFQKSWYVHTYFNEQVYDNFRYGVSFWDRINKSIMDLIRFNINLQKKWRKTQNLNHKLLLIQDCLNAPQFFVQTGYLTSLYDVPSNSKQLFDQFQQLNMQTFNLGTVHLIQQKTFRHKYQCLMKGNIQKFGKKLVQNIKVVQDQAKALESKQEKYEDKQKMFIYFQKISRNIVNLVKTI